MKVLLWVLPTLFFNIVNASSFDAIGKTYDIVEIDALSWIATRLNEMEKSGEIAKQQEVLSKKALAAIERPKKVEGLQKTVEPRVFEHDLTVTVPHDITDYDGNVIHYAGTKVNPLNQMISKQSLLFFDGEDSDQVAWALNERTRRKNLAKLVLVNGSVSEISNAHGVRVYFDQAGRLIQKFGIKQIPAIVEQRGEKLMISEVKG